MGPRKLFEVTARSVGEFRNRIRVLDWHLIDGWINVNGGRFPGAGRIAAGMSFPWVPTMKCSLLTSIAAVERPAPESAPDS